MVFDAKAIQAFLKRMGFKVSEKEAMRIYEILREPVALAIEIAKQRAAEGLRIAPQPIEDKVTEAIHMTIAQHVYSTLSPDEVLQLARSGEHAAGGPLEELPEAACQLLEQSCIDAGYCKPFQADLQDRIAEKIWQLCRNYRRKLQYAGLDLRK